LAKLTRQLAQVEVELAKKGAAADGYANDLWTLQRVSEIIYLSHGRFAVFARSDQEHGWQDRDLSVQQAIADRETLEGVLR
jgi:hypothetical protein